VSFFGIPSTVSQADLERKIRERIDRDEELERTAVLIAPLGRMSGEARWSAAELVRKLRSNGGDMNSVMCKCGKGMVHVTGQGGVDERGVGHFHSEERCEPSIDDRTLREKVLGAIGRWFIRASRG
jgi:hypothetical protein